MARAVAAGGAPHLVRERPLATHRSTLQERRRPARDRAAGHGQAARGRLPSLAGLLAVDGRQERGGVRGLAHHRRDARRRRPPPLASGARWSLRASALGELGPHRRRTSDHDGARPCRACDGPACAGARAGRTQRRAAHGLSLWLDGESNEVIATRLGAPSPEVAHRVVRSALKRLRDHFRDATPEADRSLEEPS